MPLRRALLLIDRIEMKNNTRLWKIQTASEVSSCSLLNLNAISELH